jgi:hypothetical protein
MPYGDRPSHAAVLGTAEVCGKCFGRIEPDEPLCIRSWASWWSNYSGRYISGPGPWCFDCAHVPLVDVGRVWWPDRCTPHRYHGGTCGTCGRRVTKESHKRHLTHFFCCERCEYAHYTRQRAKRRVAAREKVCEVCSKGFTASRKDAKTCSPACKQKAYREREKAAQA